MHAREGNYGSDMCQRQENTCKKGKNRDKSDLELAGKLAQQNYDEKLLSEVEKQLKNIQNIIKQNNAKTTNTSPKGGDWQL